MTNVNFMDLIVTPLQTVPKRINSSIPTLVALMLLKGVLSFGTLVCYLAMLILLWLMMCRFCQRMIPVSRVCRANMKDIQEHLGPVLQPHFHNSTDPVPVEVTVHSTNHPLHLRFHLTFVSVRKCSTMKKLSSWYCKLGNISTCRLQVP